MKNSKYTWILGTVVTVSTILIPILLFVPDQEPPQDNPQVHLPPTTQHTDHTALMPGPYESGEDVTRACLNCHPNSAEQVIHTSHWRWEGDPVYSPEHGKEITLGKKKIPSITFVSALKATGRPAPPAIPVMVGRMPHSTFQTSKQLIAWSAMIPPVPMLNPRVVIRPKG